MEMKILNQCSNDDLNIFSFAVQNYENLTIKLIHEGKKLSEVWKFYGILFYGNRTVNPHRYYCSLCFKDFCENISNGIKTPFWTVNNFSLSTATGNLKMHLFKVHNINTFPDSEKEKDDSCTSKLENRNFLSEEEGNTPDGTVLPEAINLATLQEKTPLANSFHRLKTTLANHLKSFNSLSVLSDIIYNPVMGIYYLKVSTAFIDNKWEINYFTLCYDPLESLSSDIIFNSFDSVLKKFDIDCKCSCIHTVTTISAPNTMKFSQEYCLVLQTHQLVTRDGLYTSYLFQKLLSKCLNILVLLSTSCLHLQESLPEGVNYEFLNQASEVYFLTNLDKQMPFIINVERVEKQQTGQPLHQVPHIMRAGVMLCLFKFFQSYNSAIEDALKFLNKTDLSLDENEVCSVKILSRFLCQFEEVSDIFKDCNNSLIVVPVLKNKIKELCEMYLTEGELINYTVLSILNHLDSYYQMSSLVKMACILDPSVRDILDKDDSLQLLVNALRSNVTSDEKGTQYTPSLELKRYVGEHIEQSQRPSKKLKLFESLKPQFKPTEHEDVFVKEVKEYLQHVPTVEESEMPLLFWKNYAHKYSNLSILAKEYLGIPASCSPSNSILSLDSLKSQNDFLLMSPFRLNSVSFIHNNLQLLSK